MAQAPLSGYKLYFAKHTPSETKHTHVGPQPPMIEMSVKINMAHHNWPPEEEAGIGLLTRRFG